MFNSVAYDRDQTQIWLRKAKCTLPSHRFFPWRLAAWRYQLKAKTLDNICWDAALMVNFSAGMVSEG
jgi:hypothetical protein